MQSKHTKAVRVTATGVGAVALVGGLFLLSQPMLTQAAPRSLSQGTQLVASNGAEQNEGPETNEGPQGNEGPETNDANLKASISPAQASSAAQSAQPGKVGKVELEDEDGKAVYGVHITSADGKQHDVKVDANSGKVLGNEADDGEENDGGSGDKGDGDGETND